MFRLFQAKEHFKKFHGSVFAHSFSFFDHTGRNTKGSNHPHHLKKAQQTSTLAQRCTPSETSPTYVTTLLASSPLRSTNTHVASQERSLGRADHCTIVLFTARRGRGRRWGNCWGTGGASRGRLFWRSLLVRLTCRRILLSNTLDRFLFG